MTDTVIDLAGKRVWVAGHNGMVGSAIMRRLQSEGCTLLTATRAELDLTRQTDTENWVETARPDIIFLAAARVGGILANSTYPAEFLFDNLMIEANVIEAARRCGTEKLIFLGSSCIYPKLAEQPISEDALMTGPLEQTNEWYAVAKIAGIKLAQSYRRQYGCNFISAQPTNLYGPGDNFDLQTSHVLPALIRKAHEAKLSNSPTMTVWGSGTPKREFLHVDDLADALVFLAKEYSSEDIINIGSGDEVTISELVERISAVIGFEGDLQFDSSRPDGTPRKLIDSTRLNQLGWTRKIPLGDGIKSTYEWFTEHSGNAAA